MTTIVNTLPHEVKAQNKSTGEILVYQSSNEFILRCDQQMQDLPEDQYMDGVPVASDCKYVLKDFPEALANLEGNVVLIVSTIMSNCASEVRALMPKCTDVRIVVPDSGPSMVRKNGQPDYCVRFLQY